MVLCFLQVTRGRSHKMKMKFFASLAETVSAEYPAEDIGVETRIFLILPRFQDSKFVLKSTPKIAVSGLLTRYRVGNQVRHWPKENEEDEVQVSILYFDADFTDRRGQGFMRWLERLLPGHHGGAGAAGSGADAVRI